MSQVLFGYSDIVGHGKGVMGHGCGSVNVICTAHEQCPIDRRDVKWNEQIVMGEVWATRSFKLASVGPMEIGGQLGDRIHKECWKNMTYGTVW